jgi:Uma2 family endonuclease
MPAVIEILKKQSNDFDLTEIINGEERMPPSPFTRHQELVSNLFYEIREFIKKNNIGKVFLSPLDVIFEDNVNRLQPDLIFIKTENLAISQDWIRGVPDMVAEIVSKGSFEKDTIEKKAIYEKYGVKEYWIVFPEFETIEVYTLIDGKYKMLCAAEGAGIVKSKIIEGFEIDIKTVFKV